MVDSSSGASACISVAIASTSASAPAIGAIISAATTTPCAVPSTKPKRRVIALFLRLVKPNIPDRIAWGISITSLTIRKQSTKQIGKTISAIGMDKSLESVSPSRLIISSSKPSSGRFID